MHQLVRILSSTALVAAGCTGVLTPVGEDGPGGGPGLVPGTDAGPAPDDAGPGGFDAGREETRPGVDGGPGADAGPGGGGPGGRAITISPDAERPVAILPRDRLAKVAARVGRVADPWLAGVLESSDTMFYDHASLVPGYQDSFGDNVVTPIGMRPNTIDPGLINLAVPGGHGQVFVEFGVFHFPFGRPAGSREDAIAVVDFWQLPRGDDGRLEPVVWWRRDPNGYTHRVEWMFPAGTVLGELMFVVDASGQWWPFEIRTRVRELDGWRSDVYRPFPTATELADALQRKRAERAEWSSSSEIDSLIAHLRDPSTLTSARLSATNFPGAFPAIDGAEDVLPELRDPSILQELLRETAFRSARGQVWKERGGLRAYAPTSRSAFSIVPRGYNGGFLSVDDDTCDRCHRDAGRPFRDWYDNIMAYGELWGEDESFSWHPFENRSFVDASGRVVDFNYDNREFRSDFVAAGIFVAYERSAHPDSLYRKLPGEWKDYAY